MSEIYKYFYDLHMHSCLSPCGDNDMTPNNIANMACLKGLNIIAVADHNTTRNSQAIKKAIKLNELDLLIIPAVELTTAEDIHALFYFGDYDCADKFEREILEKRRIKIKNKREIFGEQIIMNELDEPVGEELDLLINATNIGIDEVFDLANEFNAVAVPAHIDKEANGLVNILGEVPESFRNKACEIKDFDKIDSMRNKYNLTAKILSSSDAHYLWDIAEPGNVLHSEHKIENAKDFINFLKII